MYSESEGHTVRRLTFCVRIVLMDVSSVISNVVAVHCNSEDKCVWAGVGGCPRQLQNFITFVPDKDLRGQVVLQPAMFCCMSHLRIV